MCWIKLKKEYRGVIKGIKRDIRNLREDRARIR